MGDLRANKGLKIAETDSKYVNEFFQMRQAHSIHIKDANLKDSDCFFFHGPQKMYILIMKVCDGMLAQRIVCIVNSLSPHRKSHTFTSPHHT